MDAVVLCGGNAQRLNAFSCKKVDKTEIFKQSHLENLRKMHVNKIYFLGWSYENFEQKEKLEKQGIFYKYYAGEKGSFKELLALIKETNINPPFLLLYGDVLQKNFHNESYVFRLIAEYKTLKDLGYEIIMHISNVLFDYEDGNISIHNTKPLVEDYKIHNSSWMDAGMFYINAIDTKSPAETWEDYLCIQIRKKKVAYLLVDRPSELNTPYSLFYKRSDPIDL